MDTAAGANQTLAEGNAWPSDVAAFLALVDVWEHNPHVPTVATKLLEGRLTLICGQLWDKAPHTARVELLRHEASHVAHGCWARMGDRNPQAWNVCTDAIIHALGECDWALIDRETGTQCATLARMAAQLGRKSLPLMPAERLYDLLPKATGGCGSAEHSKVDDSLLSKVKAVQVGSAVLGAAQGGSGREVVGTLPPCPAWIQEVLEWLVTRVIAREDRVRAWRRSHRTAPGLLPGSSRGEAKAARFMLDASGSISPELLGQLLSAVCSTPELSGSDVVVFDHTCREPVDASDVHAVLASVKTAGGGTLIREAGKYRDPDKQTVWLTDGGTADGWPEHATQDLWVTGEGEPYPKGAPHVRRA